MGDVDSTPFADDAAILEFIKEKKNEMEGSVTPQLHLRGHRGVEFKYCRQVIQIAAEAGVDQVIFASYATPKAYN